MPRSGAVLRGASAGHALRLQLFAGGGGARLSRILEFQTIPGDSNGGFRLIVNETLYSGPLSTGASCLALLPDPSQNGALTPQYRAIEAGPHSFVLADHIAFCRFFYKERLPPEAPESWVTEWRRPRLPAAVRVEMAPLVADPRGCRWPV